MTSFMSSFLLDCARQPEVHRLGWTLLHSMWEGVVVAAVLAGALRAMRTASANARYLVACAGLALMFMGVVATFWIVNVPAADDAPATSSATPAPHHSPIAIQQTLALPTAPAPTLSAASGPDFLASLAGAWMIGVLAMGIWHAGGWLMLARLRRGQDLNHLQPMLDRLTDRLHIRAEVKLRRTIRFDVPAVIGAFRPVILLPAALLNDLSPQQVEAILAHELAHIRRHDYLVNLIQSAIETLLFYHPATWWMSAQIRRERENCCDDIASQTCGNAMLYAQALTCLEERRAAKMHLAPAISGGGRLPDRIRRVLGLTPATRRHKTRIRSVVVALLAIACAGIPVVVAAQQPSSQPDATGPGTTRPSTDQSPYTIKIGVGENSLNYQGKPVSFEALTKMLDQLPEVQHRGLSLEVTASSPRITVDRYFSAYGQIAGLVNRFRVVSLTQGGIQPTDNPSLPYLLPGTESGEYYISGVKRDGVYSLTGRKISLKQALIAAGGTIADPKVARATVIRNPGPDESIAAKDVSVEELMNEQVKDVRLHANDIVQVRPEGKQKDAVHPATHPASAPSSRADMEYGEYIIAGHVNRPGVYSVTGRKVTLKQAIYIAGGADADASRISLTLIRHWNHDGQKTVVRNLSFDDLLHGRVEDVLLHADDLVQVSQINPRAPIPGNPKDWSIDQITKVDPTLRNALEQLSALELSVARLEQHFGKQNQRVVDARADLELLKAQIDRQAADFRAKYASPSTAP
jgi:beta-lactamase regulating signal transducer with metallopeptidase domain/protein involved in polysaccharide export with SLBB domain